MRAARRYATRVGLTFHVGSQCVDTSAFERAVALVAEVVRRSGPVDRLDIGGGFPPGYKGDEPSFEAFVAVVERRWRSTGYGWRSSASPAALLVATVPRCWPGSSCDAAGPLSE